MRATAAPGHTMKVRRWLRDHALQGIAADKPCVARALGPAPSDRRTIHGQSLRIRRGMHFIGEGTSWGPVQPWLNPTKPMIRG